MPQKHGQKEATLPIVPNRVYPLQRKIFAAQKNFTDAHQIPVHACFRLA
jgi:hypothetical protein